MAKKPREQAQAQAQAQALPQQPQQSQQHYGASAVSPQQQLTSLPLHHQYQQQYQRPRHQSSSQSQQQSQHSYDATCSSSSSSAAAVSSSSASAPASGSGYHSLSRAYQTYLRHDQEEQNHWEDVARSFRQYATFAMAQWANHQYRLHALPEEQRKYLPPALRRDTPEFQQRATLYKDAAIRNQFLLDCILRHAGQPHSQESSAATATKVRHSTDSQMSKVSSVLKSLARDWSSEGKQERDMAYKPILERVRLYVPIQKSSRTLPRICVPGAGVGRLACELCAAGYSVQGNEFSLYMLLASDFILNGGAATPQRPLKISPFLLESRNVHAATDPVRAVTIPDVDPYNMLMHNGNNDNSSNQNQQQQQKKPNNISTKTTIESSTGADNKVPTDEGAKSSSASVPPPPRHAGGAQQSREKCPAAAAKPGVSPTEQSQQQQAQPLRQLPEFSMAAGEFVSIYGKPHERGQWDAVVACFFLDASPSIVEYLQVIHHMLKPGGVLINFGPLLWHWSGPAMRPDDNTVEDYHKRNSYLDKKYMTSVDLCWEDVEVIIGNIGFEILDVKVGARALYTADRRSMMNMNYRCTNFVARKKAETRPAPTTKQQHQQSQQPAIAKDQLPVAAPPAWAASEAAVAAAAAAAAAAVTKEAPLISGLVSSPLQPPLPPPQLLEQQKQLDNASSSNEVTVGEDDSKGEDTTDISSLMLE